MNILAIGFGSWVVLFLMLNLCFNSLARADDLYERDYVAYWVDVPGDFELEVEPGGSLERGWVPYTYSYTTSTPFTASRQVVVGERSVPVYGERPVYEDRIVGYDYEPIYEEARYREETHTDYEWQRVWRWKWAWFVPYYWYDWELVPVTLTRSVPYRVTELVGYKSFPIYERVLVGYERYVAGYRTEPVYGIVYYTRYHNTRYEVTDYAPADWPSIETTITLRSTAGFSGEVELRAEADDSEIRTELSDETLHLETTASTILTITPSSAVEGSPHRITATATSGGRTKSGTYELDLQASKPSSSVSTSSWDSDRMPDEVGSTRGEVEELPPIVRVEPGEETFISVSQGEYSGPMVDLGSVIATQPTSWWWAADPYTHQYLFPELAAKGASSSQIDLGQIEITVATGRD